MSYSNLPLHTLLRDIACGGAPQSAAIRQLYTTYRQPYLRFFRGRGVDYAQAEDLTQEVFILIVRKAASFRGESPAAAASWLWTIARNQWIDYSRRTQHEAPVPDTEPDLEDRSSSLQEAIQAQALDDCVVAALQTFAQAHPERAEAIRLAALEQFSIAQLAEFIGRTVGATREYLSQCRKYFKTFLEPCRRFMAPCEEDE